MRRTGIAGLGSLRLDGPVMVHLDMDVLDADNAPAFNYPVAGGPSIASVSRACRASVDGKRVAVISVCGWTGALDADGGPRPHAGTPSRRWSAEAGTLSFHG